MESVHEDTIRIFLTSDNHLGFLENDPIRGNDSFVTFGECLTLAGENSCDMCILGGDLFHEHKPSLRTLTRTMDILRNSIMGPQKPNISIECQNKGNSTSLFPLANYSDSNYRIQLPIFAIHGNHDDSISGYSPLNLLSSGGMLNYFGQVRDLDKIELDPILIVKGKTRIALYGLGHIRDERLHRCFTLGKISLNLPVDDGNGLWFRILVLHQNRGVRADVGKAGIYEDMLIGMVDLVLWGNEHEQRAFPSEVFVKGTQERSYDIIQPGSTIMTALHSDETNPKAGCIIEIENGSLRVGIHPLKSIRGFRSRFVALQQENVTKQKSEVEKFLVEKVDNLLRLCNDASQDIPDYILQQNPKLDLPIIRININYSSITGPSYPFIHPARFGQLFVGRIANPQNILHEVRQLKGTGKVGQDVQYQGRFQEISTRDVRIKIEDLLKISTQNVCTLLCEDSLATAVCQYAEKDEKSAIESAIKKLVEGCEKFLWRELRSAVGPGKPCAIENAQFVEYVTQFKKRAGPPSQISDPQSDISEKRGVNSHNEVLPNLSSSFKDPQDTTEAADSGLQDFITLSSTSALPKQKSNSRVCKPKQKRSRT